MYLGHIMHIPQRNKLVEHYISITSQYVFYNLGTNGS